MEIMGNIIAGQTFSNLLILLVKNSSPYPAKILTETLKSPEGRAEKDYKRDGHMEKANEINNDGKPAQRHAVELAFEFKKNYARQSSKAEVCNISLTGALIKTDQPLKPSEKLNVYLSVSGRTRKVAARVIWVGARGVGLQFEPFNNRDLQIVDDIIYYATEKNESTKSVFDSILNKVA